MPTGISLVNAAACDAICVLLLELQGYTKQDFAKTHPEGAVGKKLAGEIEDWLQSRNESSAPEART